MGRHQVVAVPTHSCAPARARRAMAGAAAGAAAMALIACAGRVAAQSPIPPVSAIQSSSAVPADAHRAPRVVLAGPDAQPGAVVSVAVRVPAGGRRAGAAFTVTPAAGVKLFGAASGELAWAGDEPVLPLAFATPRSQPPGPMGVARIDVRWPDGDAWHANVIVNVAARRALRLRFDTTAAMLQRGRPESLGFTLVNAGNAPDSADVSLVVPDGWRADGPPRLVVQPGAEARGVVTVTTPTDALLGETRVLHVVAAGRDGEASGSVQVEVGTGVDEASTWVNMPATVTVGFTEAAVDGGAPLALGLEAAGRVGYGTDASVSVRHTPRQGMAPVFQRYLSGPALRIGLRRGDNSVSAGDLMLGGGALAGSVTQGSGVEARARLGLLTTHVYGARPRAWDAVHASGALLHAAAELPVRGGIIGVRVADLARPYGFAGATERTGLLTARFATALRQPFTAQVETGLMRLEDDEGRTRAGAAVDLQTRYAEGRLDVSARLRRVPGALATSGPAIDESFLGAALQVGSGLALSGWAAHTAIPLLDGGGSRYDGAALSLQWRQGVASAQVGGRASRTSTRGFFGADASRHSVVLGGTAPLGPVTLDGTLELGRARVRDVERPLRSVLARASWLNGPFSLWLGTTHTRGLYATSYHRTDVGAAVHTRRVELEAAVGANLVARDGRDRALSAWTSATVHTDPRTALVLGLDYSRWSAGGMRISFGARRAFALPLPLRRPAIASGTVFDDLDGDLARGPDEPPVADVRIRRGGHIAITDAHGAFAFRAEAAARELRVDVASLPPGMLVPPEVMLAPEGRADVPVHRAAALTMSLYDDVDGDGTRDEGERTSAAAMVLLVDARGRTRTALADSTGTIVFRALSPGVYRVRAAGTGDSSAEGQPLTVRLVPGEGATLNVPVPVRARPIRFRAPPAATPAAPADARAPATAGTRPS